MATTFKVFFLGTDTLIDPTEGDAHSENASALVGNSYGSSGSPLFGNIQTLSEVYNGATFDAYDSNNSISNDTFSIDGGAAQTFDGIVVYNATITYLDGSTANISAVVFQDTDGKLYLAPEYSENADQDALEAKPIQTLTLDSVSVDNSNMTSSRVDGDYFVPDPDGTVDGTAGADSITAGYFDADYDLIDGSDGDDDVIVSGSGNDTIDGGHGADTIDGGADNDVIRGGVGGDSIQGGSGDDHISGDFAGSEPAGFDFYYVSSAYVQGENFSIPDGEDLIGSPENLSITGDATVVRFTDNDSVIDGDDATNEQADDTNQTVEIDGVEYNYAVDFSLDYTDGTNTYTFAVLDVDLNNDGFLDHGSDAGNGKIIIQTGGPVIPAGTDLVYVSGSLTNTSTLDYSTFGDISAHNFDDTIDGGDGHDTIDGGIGADSIDGGSNHDLIYGGDGDDTIDGGSGNDTIYGEDGDDLIYEGSFTDNPGEIHGGSGNDTIYGGTGAGSDLLIGDEGDDLIVDLGTHSTSNDTLQGGAGSDTLDGGAGADSLEGGDDADTFIIKDGFGADTISGGSGVTTGSDFDTIDLSALTGPVTVNYTDDEDGTITDGTDTITFTGVENIILTDYSDYVDGMAADGITIEGGAGDDTIIGGDSNTSVGDSIDGGTGNDSISGFWGADTLLGGDGDDTIDGGDQGDLIYGGDGNDFIDAGEEDNFGDDDLVYGGDGNDTIISTETDSNSNDTIYGEAGDDVISTQGGDAHLDGGTGDDTLTGGSGDDSLDGGDGSDTFIALDGFGNDTVTGGDGGTNDDTIDVSALSGGVTVSYTGNDDGTITFGSNSIGFDQIERLALTDFSDLVDARQGTGTSLDTADGDDTISVNGGAYDIDAGDGDDRIIRSFMTNASDANSVIDAGAGTDTYVVDNNFTSSNTVDLEAQKLYYGASDRGDLLNFENVELINSSAKVIGDGNDNLITATGTHDNILEGGGGADTIDAGGGADTISGGTGADSLSGGDDADTFILANAFGSDTIVGGEGGTDSDTIDGSAVTSDLNVTFSGDEAGTIIDGADTISFSQVENVLAGSGADTLDASADSTGVGLFGNAGDDLISGGTGADSLSGGDDADTFILANAFGSDTIVGGEGGTDADTIDGSAVTSDLNVTFSGDEAGTIIDGADTLSFSQVESIFAGSGADTLDASAESTGVGLFGNAGDDLITGGSGADYIDGGDGSDTIALNDGFGTDTIIGGEGGTDSDTLDLRALTGPVTVTYTGDEAGTVTDGTDTITFSEIENIFLTDGNDVVDGTSDSAGLNIFAEDGADSVLGGSGGDSLDGGAGDDTLDAGDGNDSLTGGTGEDLLYGGYGDDTIDGGDGDDTIQGNWGDDSITGGDGSDVFQISSSAESDTIVGGEGGADFDTMSYVGSDGVNVTFSGDETGSYSFPTGDADGFFSQIEAVSGTSGNDTLDGSATTAGVQLSGEDGFDRITGGSGADSLSGGDGNDTFIGSAGADTIDGGGWWDEISYANSDAGVNVDISDGLTETGGHAQGDVLSNIQAIDGSGFDDTIVGNSSDNALDGLDGNDSLVGGGGNDTLVGGAGLDTLEGGTGADSIWGNDGDDSIDGGDGDDVIDGGNDNDTIDGGDGNDTIDGGSGNDRISAGSGDDSVVGGEGDDLLSGNSGSDTLFGSDGADVVEGEDGADSLDGGAGDDTIIGYNASNAFGGSTVVANDDGASDTLSGGAGNDKIYAGSGDDSISGGVGDDSITAGAGDDTLLYSVGDGADTITDFNAGNSGTLDDGDNTNNDFIDLSGFYDNLSELYADLADDNRLNQSNATDTKGRSVDYSDNTEFGAGDSLSFTGASADNSFFTAENTGVVCFTAGTAIRTPHGDVLIDDLKVGDLVTTMDNGPQKIRWISKRSHNRAALSNASCLLPVLIRRDVLGAERDLWVSQQHGVLIGQGGDWFARAKHLAKGTRGIRIAHGTQQVTYIHLMFDAHQVIFAENVATESFYPGPMALNMLEVENRRLFAKRFAAFYPTGGNPATVSKLYGPTARPFIGKKAVQKPPSNLRILPRIGELLST